jgi:hypothetical protein
MKMKKILLDTNFLMICFQFRVDIFTELDRVCNFNFKLFVLDKTIEEIEKIVEEQKGKNKEAAKIALKLIAIKKINIIKTKSNRKTDDVIRDIAAKDNYIVATQDKDLKRRLINQGASVIVLRQKKVLAIINDKGFA